MIMRLPISFEVSALYLFNIAVSCDMVLSLVLIDYLDIFCFDACGVQTNSLDQLSLKLSYPSPEMKTGQEAGIGLFNPSFLSFCIDLHFSFAYRYQIYMNSCSSQQRLQEPNANAPYQDRR